MRHHNNIISAAILSLASVSAPAGAEQPAESRALSYSDIADSVSVAPIVAVGKIVKAKRLRGDLATNVPEGRTRFLVTVKLSALLRGADGLPERIEYLYDSAADRNGRPPKLTKGKVVLAGAPVPGDPASIQLVSPRAQMDWTETVEATAREIVTEAVAPGAPPRITGVGNAFHVRGSLPGESETQIFLKTVDDQPVSLNVLRRPGEDVQWAAALGEMIDDSAKPPERNTLLWYSLACFLPPDLPPASVASLDVADAIAASTDYRFVIEALGPCGRTPLP